MKTSFVWFVLFLCACGGREKHPVFRAAIADRIREVTADLPPPLPAPALTQSAAEEIRDLLQIALASPARTGRIAKASLLEREREALPFLKTLLSDKAVEPDAKLRAAQLLGEFRSSDAAAILLEMIEKDASPSARLSAAEALGKCGQSWVLPRFLLRLKYERDPAVVAGIAEGLSSLGNFSGVGEIFEPNDQRNSPVQSQREGDPEWIRETLRAVLDRAGESAAREMEETALFERAKGLALDWKEGRVVQAASVQADPRFELEILQRIKNLGLQQLRDVDDARYCLEHLSGIAVPGLILALEDESYLVRFHAMEVLGVLGSLARSAAPAVLKLSSVPSHRADALHALGKIGASESVGEIRKGLLDPDPEVRMVAAIALGDLGNPEAIPDLQKAIAKDKERRDFVAAAAGSLAVMGEVEGFRLLLEEMERGKLDIEVLWRRMDRAFESRRSSGKEDFGYFVAKNRDERIAITRKFAQR